MIYVRKATDQFFILTNSTGCDEIHHTVNIFVIFLISILIESVVCNVHIMTHKT